MDLRYINPFVASAVSVIQEAVGINAKKKQIYIAKGKESLGGVSIFLNIKGDVEGQIIFDLPPGIATVIAKEMIGLNLKEVVEDDEQKELFKSAITELGNMISGTAITRLEEHQYNCEITPPQVYVGPKTRLTHPSMSTIVIEMNTKVGDFSINLINKKDHYLDNITILAVKTSQDLVTSLVHEFLPKGFYVYHSDDFDATGRYYLREKKVDFIFLDADFYATKLDSIINDCRDSSSREKPRIIIYSSRKEPDFLNRIKALAVSGFILKDLPLHQVMAKVQGIFARMGVKLSERRKHIISKVLPEDKFRLNLLHPKTSETIAGSLKEVGVTGVTFVPDEAGLAESFLEHMDVKDVQLNLRGKFIMIDGVISGRKDDEVAIRFTSVREKFVHMLSEIVFNKISSF